MNTYQVIVLGIVLSLLFGGVYYIKKSDDAGVLSYAFSSSNKKIDYSPPLTVEDVAGKYLCESSSGCADPHTLDIEQTGAVHLITSYNEGVESFSEDGSWRFENGGLITLSFSDSSYEHYEVPRTILIQSVSTSTLSKFVFDTKFYTGMYKPTFVKLNY